MAKFLVSPSETELLAKLGDDAISSSLPESKGADILIYSKQGLYGAQRKKVPGDFILSVEDGRLARSTSIITKECKFYEVICEGRFRYYPNGQLAVDRKEPSRYTRRQIRGILFDIKYVKGVMVEHTEDMDDTANYLKWMYGWLNESTHMGLYRRPSLKGEWYVPTVEELHSWILQSWPGIGPATAETIIKHFGHIPLKWTCTAEEMSKVPRLSKNKVNELLTTFDPSSTERFATSRGTGAKSKTQKPEPQPTKSMFDSLREKLNRNV